MRVTLPILKSVTFPIATKGIAMAKRVITQVVFEDDLTGDEVPEEEITTQRFTYGGVTYEIDLGKASTAKFAKAMAPFVEAARRVGGRTSKKAAGGAKATSGHTPAEIRDWARSNSIEVPKTGRIPQEVIDHFELAHAS